ncbi:filament-like plant protein 7 isoform X2 [Spinacia oleracea]|uniref:Filament-like plant protein 7 isoform X2 n=1 Tax=Spinacia oleracea TaxID=3562 RepID=A0ABM3RML3_SPIOL|nr:filament-like plant protein 7 isoform X2 [Spinacia oleracea]
MEWKIRRANQMTDHKPWIWKKKPSEKTIMAIQKAEIASKENEEKVHVLLAEKSKLERDLKDLGEKLSSSLAECSAKDDLANKHSKSAKEALAGWEKEAAKALSLQEELDEALKERDISEERTRHLDGALKECMQQLRFVREEKEQRIHDVMLKASEELEQTRKFLEEKLEESGEMIAKLTAENSQLCEVIMLKDQLIEELNQEKAKAKADINDLFERLEHLQKDNSSLLYEVRILEKEVDIRNEEKEFNRRTDDATHKQHLENVKKIAKLESECQRLRLLVRKRLPGPAALAKMKSEVDMLGRDSRKKSNLSNASSMQLDYGIDSYPDSPEKKTNHLSEKIRALEEENNSVRETLEKKMNELQMSRNMYIQVASKLSRLEAQVDESHKNELIRDARSSIISSNDFSDIGSDNDKVSCNGSWASKSVGVPDINHLMDDFAEMEKLALVCVENPINENALENESKEISKWISKLIEIIQGINFPSEDSDASQTQTDNVKNECCYTVRVFQWRTSELASILQNFLRICHDLMNGKAGFEAFTQEMTCVLEWILNHCDETRSESETEYKNESCFNVSEEGRKVQDSAKYELECESLRNELQNMETTVANLRSEMEALKHDKDMIEEQFETQKMTNEDLNSQLLAANSRMDEAHKKISTIQEEMVNKVNHCEELEAKCRDLQVELERVQTVDTMDHTSLDEKKHRNEWEISAASEKLAECQETILHLGKQLQAMASTRDAVVSDKFISTPTKTAPASAATSTPSRENKPTCQRSSLMDQLQTEDIDETDRRLESPKTKEVISTNNNNNFGSHNTTGNNNVAKMNDDIDLGSFAIIPYQKQQATSGGLFKKLLRRKRRSNSSSKKMPLSFAV